MRMQILVSTDSMKMDHRESMYSTQVQEREHTNTCLMPDTTQNEETE